MRVALDPAVLAWAITPAGAEARAALLEHACFLPLDAMEHLRRLQPSAMPRAQLSGHDVWQFMEALVARVRIADHEAYEDFMSLSRRLVPEHLASTLAVGLAIEADAILAGGPGFEQQELLSVMPAWPKSGGSREEV